MSLQHLERVAIVGAGGHIGSHMAAALVATRRHTVTGLTRVGSTTPLPDGVDRVEVDYADHASLVSVLRSRRIQFLIITLSVTAPPETHSQIVRAAGEAGVAYVMPNAYGGDIFNESLGKEDGYTSRALAKCCEIESLPETAFVALCCGFWFEWSLAGGENFFGFDIAAKKAVLFDDGRTRMTTSTWPQCGRAVAGLLGLPEAVIRERGLRNAAVYVGSFTVCQRDVLDSLHRVLGTTDADWQIRHQPSRERYEEGLRELAGGDRAGFAKALYARGFFPGGGGDVEHDKGLHNDLLGLKKEDLDGAVRRAVDMVQSGWKP